MNNVKDMLVAFAGNLPGIQTLIFTIAALAGVYSIGHGLIGQIKQGKSGGGMMASTFAWLFCGSLLLSVPAFVEVWLQTIFAGDANVPRSGLGYSGPVSSDPIEVSLQAIVYIIAVIGWIAVIKGLLIWRGGPESGKAGWFSSGFVFILGGVLCTNISVFVDYLAGSVGQIAYGSVYLNY